MEKRHAPRIATSNFLGYVCLDNRGQEISEGYGWTTNLSHSGIQMETFRVVESRMVLLLAIDLNEELLEIKGEVIYSKLSDNKKHVYGIRFLDSEIKQKKMVSAFVKSYYKRDKKMMRQMNNNTKKGY